MPLCFSCMLALLFPVTICPMAYCLRRIVVDTRGIHESPVDTCGILLCCLPCAIAQTADEAKIPSMNGMVKLVAVEPPESRNAF